ncbi:RNA-guided endonuclease InsQ/TnpB family protein, partial [Levilactobacillus parabrevis]
IKNHDLVVAEELRSKNMLQNHALAMSITDVGWRTLLAMLSYKADLYGRKFLTINPRNTTQTCSDCGHVLTDKNKLTLADRKWTCPSCGTFHVRDHNAAKNILAKGLATL